MAREQGPADMVASAQLQQQQVVNSWATVVANAALPAGAGW